MFFIYTIVLILAVPSSIVILFNAKDPTHVVNKGEHQVTKLKSLNANAKTEEKINISVFREKQNLIQKVELEDYVKGVLASEMPTSFEKEALKAQAVVARNYIIDKLLKKKDNRILKGADLADTVDYQVYKNEEELKKVWKNNF